MGTIGRSEDDHARARGHDDLDLRDTPPLVYRTILRSCSWCDTLNPAHVARCTHCGHDAQRPRMACTCARCRRPGPV